MHSDEQRDFRSNDQPVGMQAASLQSLEEQETMPAAVAEASSFETIIQEQSVAEQPGVESSTVPVESSDAQAATLIAATPDPWAESAEMPTEAPLEPLAVVENLAAFDRPNAAQPDAAQPDAAQPDASPSNGHPEAVVLHDRVAALHQEIADLERSRDHLKDQIAASQMSLGRLIQDGLNELEQRRQALQASIEQLERRQERIRKEMRSTFAGTSQDIAIRVQSFKEYLVGSLQDLAMAAEQLDLPTAAPAREPEKPAPTAEPKPQSAGTPQFGESPFIDQTKRIRNLIDQYRTRPDYYGPPWHLRRTFEPIHADRVSNWFFTQGGRGAIRTLGSRLQNILVASATISILHSLYRDRLATLVLAQSPERLGEWRRGLQDCLGITRSDFGPDRGVALFEDPYPLAQKADRLVKEGSLPLIIIDDTEDQISLAMLQFPLWLAFAPSPQQMQQQSYLY